MSINKQLEQLRDSTARLSSVDKSEHREGEVKQSGQRASAVYTPKNIGGKGKSNYRSKGASNGTYCRSQHGDIFYNSNGQPQGKDGPQGQTQINRQNFKRDGQNDCCWNHGDMSHFRRDCHKIDRYQGRTQKKKVNTDDQNSYQVGC